MTDIQLSVLLDQYAKRIRSALAEATERLPSEAFVSRKNFFGVESASVPALDGILEIAEELEKSVKELTKAA